LSPLSGLGRLAWSRDPQSLSVVPVKTILRILKVIAFVFDSDREGLIRAAAPDPQWQIPLQIRAAITRIVLLIMLIVPKHIDPVEIRLFQLMRFARAALLQDDPTTRLRLLLRSLIACIVLFRIFFID